jgi:DNA repair exonuclease SbcCD nuclease subunit
MSEKILHLADLHIGYSPGYLDEPRRSKRSDELKAALRRVVDHALEPRNAIRAVIIAGDLFDAYQPASGDTGFVAAQLERLSSASIPVLVVPGTHDSIGYPESVYLTQSFPPHVYILAGAFRRPPLELRLGGEQFRFYWFTYEPAEKQSLGDYLASIKSSSTRPGSKAGFPGPASTEGSRGVNSTAVSREHDSTAGSAEAGYRVLIAHASLKGSPAWEMRRKDLPVSLEDLLSSGMDYVALGHYHNFWESGVGPARAGAVQAGSGKSEAGAARATKVVYPGTLEGKCFGENGPRYLVTAEFGAGRVTLEKTQFNSRVLEERELSLDSETISSEQELARRIASLGREDLLLRLVLTGRPDFPVRAEFLRQALAEKFFHIEIEDGTSVLSSVSTEAIARENTIRGMFVRKLLEGALSASEKDRAVYELALKEGLSAFDERR